MKKQVAEELDQKVAQRTAELQAANERLTKEVAERKIVEEKLRRNKAYLKEAERLSHVGSWAYDVVRRVWSYWSEERCRISGFDPAQGAPPVERERATHRPEDWAKMLEAIEQAIREKSDFQTEACLTLPDGTIKHLHIVGHPVLNEAGEVVELVGSTMDVTAHHRSEALLANERRVLELTTKELESERDRLRLLLEINKALVANFDLQDLFKALAGHLRIVTGCDFIGLALPDAECGLRQHLVDFGKSKPTIRGGMPVPLEGSASGRAFRTRQLVCLDRVQGEQPDPEIYGTPEGREFYQFLLQAGVPSGYFLPLVHRGEVVGVIQLVKYAALPLKTQTAEFLHALGNQLAAAVANALEHRALIAARDRLASEQVYLREEIDRSSMFEEIVGTSAALQTVLARVSKVAPTGSNVLITGETGTGKELIARAIHKRSARSNGPFVSVNCASIPQSLIASELFGHEKGAFTGALRRRPGRFELAQGGTLFLDEVGELPAETQIALLSVLQDREFERVGGTQPIRADVRLIAATNRDLETEISQGAFRSDLFYRLHVFPIEMPALRSRKEDIAMLTEYFIHRYAGKMGRKITSISRQTLELFQAYDWPGNIRELQNIVERSLIVCEQENFSVDESWLARKPRDSEPPLQPLAQRMSAGERELIETALAATGGRVSGPAGAAVRLGMPASTLESKIRALRINKHQFKTCGAGRTVGLIEQE
jgi:formate hydrogenlyase transcriptional activator